ncbi:MAG: hypothetical protein ACREAM_09415 [Blastocatellia bacterium]
MANGSSTQTAKAIDALIGVLEDFLPPPPPGPPLPPPTVSLSSVDERGVGLGNRVGQDLRGPFGVATLKGVRLDAVARYQLWAGAPGDVEAASQALITQLLGALDDLRAKGVLRLALKSVSASEEVTGAGWRQIVEFSVLFEFPYSDTEGAESLIARIPINIDGVFGEQTVVTDEMARWDNEAAPALVLRGRMRIGRLSALAFIPGAAPGGAVTLTRTFDGATGAPTVHPDLPSFLAAVTQPNNPERHSRMSFASLNDFLNEFGPAGDDFTLGDWNTDSAPDIYQSKALAIEPAVELPSATDRFEIAFQNPNFNQVAVVYLRATRG